MNLDRDPLPPGFRRSHKPRPRGLSVALDKPLRPTPTWRERGPATHEGNRSAYSEFDPFDEL